MKTLLILAAVWSCSPDSPINPNDPVSEVSCEDAAEHLESLGCTEQLIVPGPDEIPGNADDVDWVVFCEAINMSGITKIDTGCIVLANDCGVADGC